MEDKKIKKTVREGYARIANQKSSCCGSTEVCCGNTPSSEDMSKNVGYTEEQLESVPEGANLGLGCGNPTALLSLKEGEVVLDLGSGAGFDCFLAANKIGKTGKVIGIDMTPEMLRKARSSISKFTEKTGLGNVEFRLGEIEHLPVADSSIDVVISNCVINLSPDKQQVWNEIARVLKPGGKASISDLALKRPLPQEVLKSAAAIVSCVAGAVLIDETIITAKQAGLIDIRIDEEAYSIDLMADCNDLLYREFRESLPPNGKLSDYIVSINITAFKP